MTQTALGVPMPPGEPTRQDRSRPVTSGTSSRSAWAGPAAGSVTGSQPVRHTQPPAGWLDPQWRREAGPGWTALPRRTQGRM